MEFWTPHFRFYLFFFSDFEPTMAKNERNSDPNIFSLVKHREYGKKLNWEIVLLLFLLLVGQLL